MKKILTTIRYTGDILIAIAFIWSLVATHSSRAFKYMPIRYCLGIGVLLLIPLTFYKMWHWDEYEKENKQNLIFITSLIVIMIVAAIVFIK